MPEEQPTEMIRVRMPRGREQIGVIDEMLGASRFRVTGKDGRTRICRIPGKFRKSVKISPGDLVLIEPWEIEPDAKADIIWIYTRTQAGWLRKRGMWQ
ncbi:MAG: translation initiation factor IF-1A [Candidatus Aenigmarchaeota archaeon]|nr:translation initiation factor IF-1A [Candidatus Aenigmarchaeota archaeon]